MTLPGGLAAREVARQRADRAQQTALALVSAYDVMVYEDLKLTSMTARPRPPGQQVVAVSPRYTSQRCAQCGNQAHAEVNAARNILRAGPALLKAQETTWTAAPKERWSHDESTVH